MNTQSTRMVTFKNMTTGTFVINEPAYGIRRVFNAKGAIQTIPFEIVEQLLWSEGFRNCIDNGMIYIENMQDKIDLGLEEPETTEPTNIKILSPERMKAILSSPMEDFLKEIDGCPMEQIRLLAEYAADNNFVEVDKVDVIKKLTGLDIINMISRRRQAEDADQIAAEKEANRRRDGEFNAI